MNLTTGTVVQVGTTEGLRITGSFVSVDDDGAVTLRRTVQLNQGQADHYTLIPGNHVTLIEWSERHSDRVE